MDEESLQTVVDIVVAALRDGATEVRVKVKRVVGVAEVKPDELAGGTKPVFYNHITITEDLG